MHYELIFVVDAYNRQGPDQWKDIWIPIQRYLKWYMFRLYNPQISSYWSLKIYQIYHHSELV